MDDDDNPIGGKWTYDDENRKKYPKNKIPPSIKYPKADSDFHKEAKFYVESNYPINYGKLDSEIKYPTDYPTAKSWLNDFRTKIS